MLVPPRVKLPAVSVRPPKLPSVIAPEKVFPFPLAIVSVAVPRFTPSPAPDKLPIVLEKEPKVKAPFVPMLIATVSDPNAEVEPAIKVA